MFFEAVLEIIFLWAAVAWPLSLSTETATVFHNTWKECLEACEALLWIWVLKDCLLLQEALSKIGDIKAVKTKTTVIEKETTKKYIDLNQISWESDLLG